MEKCTRCLDSNLLDYIVPGWVGGEIQGVHQKLCLSCGSWYAKCVDTWAGIVKMDSITDAYLRSL